MEKVILFYVSALFLTACQSASPTSAHESAEPIDAPIVVDQRRISEPSLNFQVYHKNARITSQAEMRDQLVEHRQLEATLEKLSPIPIQPIGVSPSIDLAEADKRYRKFVTEHSGNPILPLFQQRYARFIVTEYALEKSQNWPLLAYYTDQLLTSHSFDYATITNSITSLDNHIPVSQFKALQTRALAGATARQETGNQAILAVERMIAKAEQKDRAGKLAPMDKLMLDGQRRLVKKLKDEALTQQVSTLKQLAAY